MFRFPPARRVSIPGSPAARLVPRFQSLVSVRSDGETTSTPVRKWNVASPVFPRRAVIAAAWDAKLALSELTVARLNVVPAACAATRKRLDIVVYLDRFDHERFCPAYADAEVIRGNIAPRTATRAGGAEQ